MHRRTMTPAYMSLEPFSNSKWTVYKDSFEPQPSIRRLRAWERAPVPAHAPRLQGQKIWKRLEPRSQAQDDKENYKDVQAELEKSGEGARKRQRLMGAKEVIGDALWVEEEHVLLPACEETRSPQGAELLATLGSEGENLHYVPRKRTNARRVISPKKSLHKQPTTRVETTKVPLKPEDNNGSKPARRRKSMRTSTRKSLMVEAMTDLEEDLREQDRPALHRGEQDGDALIDSTTQSRGSDTAIEGIVTGIPVSTSTFQFEVVLAKQLPARQATTASADVLPSELLARESASLGAELVGEYTEVENQPHETSFPIYDRAASCPPPSPPSEEPPKLTHHETALLVIGSDNAYGDKVVRDGSNLDTVPTKIPAQAEDMMAEPRTRHRTPTKESSSSGKSLRRSTRVSTRLTPARSTCSCASDAQESVPSEPSLKASFTLESKATDLRGCPKQVPTNLITGASNTVDGVNNAEADLEEQASLGLAEEIAQSQFLDRGEGLHNLLTNEHGICKSPQPADPMKTEGGLRPQPRMSEEDNCSQSSGARVISEVPSPEGLNHDVFHSIEVTPMRDAKVTETSTDAVDDTQNDAHLLVVCSLPSVLSSIDFNADEQSDTDSLDDNEALDEIPVTLDTEAFTLSGKAGLVNSAEAFTPDAVTTQLTETISLNASSNIYDHEDDTDMLRNFLTKVKANKAAKAASKRKRSLPHSPLQVSLGEIHNPISPSPLKKKDGFDISVLVESPAGKRKRGHIGIEEENTEPQSVRRSTRTRPAVVRAPLGAPSFIPVRRLGQDQETTVTLKRNEEKELATLTRVNTRKNKGGSLPALEVLAKKSAEKEDPHKRLQYLKDAFDEKNQTEKKAQNKQGNNVAWAEELARYQGLDGREVAIEKRVGIEEKTEEQQGTAVENKKTEKEDKINKRPVEEKAQRKTPVRVGVGVRSRSKIALGMATNGTPAPNRRLRGKT